MNRQSFSSAILILLQFLHLALAQDLVVVDPGDITRIAGMGVFSKRCVYMGTDSGFDHLEWLLNGTLFESGGTGETGANLVLSPPQLMHFGEYSCLARDTNGAILVDAISAGFLSVYDSSERIDAPPTQYVLLGGDITLQCSSTIPGHILIWIGSSNLPTLTNVSFQNRGEYECQIFHSSAVLYNAVIFLEVIVPPTILASPTIQDTYMNDLTTFTVSFMSSFKHTTTTRWLKDNVMLTGDGITTAYDSNNITGNTTLTFSPHLTRADNGEYSVIIENNITIIPTQRRVRRTDFNFTIRVVVPPSPPSPPHIVIINNTLSRISWNLTNTTADAGPESFIVLVTNHPASPITLPPSAREYNLETEPGVSYLVTITAMNPDSHSESHPEHLSIPPAAPLVFSATAIRLNETTFNFSLQVVYTGVGPGALHLVNIMFRETGSVEYTLLTSVVELVADSSDSQHWYGVLSDSQFADATDIEFLMNTQNSMDLGVATSATQSIAVPGPPENITLLSRSSNSLRVQIKLSLIGSSPLLSAHLLLRESQSESTALPLYYNITKDLQRGGRVVFDVGGLLPDTSYSVVIYATNAAGKGVDSRNKIFKTSPVSILHSWIIIIAVVGSALVIILVFVTLLVLISCVCRRHSRNDRKITLSSSPPKRQFSQSRPGPIGASDSVDSLHTSNYAYSQKGFILSPAPQGTLTSRTGSFVSPYHFSKQHLRGGSMSDSDNSEPPSKIDHFNFRHSPAPAPPASLLIIDEMELKYSRSMPMLDHDIYDPDLSPTMPPDCATDV